jgi:hypothetical protein
MFWSFFDKMGLGSKDLIPHKGSLIGFTGDTITPKGYVDLKVCFRKKFDAKTIPVRFIVVDFPSAYNAIIGRPMLNSLGVIVSNIHLTMKYPGRMALWLRSMGRVVMQDVVTMIALKSQKHHLPCQKSMRRKASRRWKVET